MEVPSFVRLFMMRRLIAVAHAGNKKALIKQLTLVLSDFDVQAKANTILTRLMKHSLKHYMTTWYDEKSQAAVIELIFHQIIATKFPEICQQITTYRGRSKSQNAVFNTKDLMSLVLHFLEYGKKFNGDLYHCSLVCSHWLYHVYNPNSVYFVHLGALMGQTHSYTTLKSCSDKNTNNNGDNSCIRMWQRLTKARGINISCNFDPTPNEVVFKKLLLFNNVDKIYGYCCINDSASIPRMINEKWWEKIRYFGVSMYSPSESTTTTAIAMFPALKLLNAKYIYAKNNQACFITWSNVCEKLDIMWNKNINKQWFNHVINYCDCSCIQSLYIEIIEKSDLNNQKSEQLKSTFANFAQKFKKLQNVTICYTMLTGCYPIDLQQTDKYITTTDSSVSSALVESMQPMIGKSEVKFIYKNLLVHSSFDELQISSQAVANGGEIHKVKITFPEYANIETTKNHLQKLVAYSMSNVVCLELSKYKSALGSDTVQNACKPLFNTILLDYIHHHRRRVDNSTLAVIQFNDQLRGGTWTELSDIVSLLSNVSLIHSTNMKGSPLLVILDCMSQCDDEQFQVWIMVFQKFCQIVKALLKVLTLGIDITVKFKCLPFFTKCLKIFSSHLKNEPYVLPYVHGHGNFTRFSPTQMSFNFNEKDNCHIFRVKNGTTVKVENLVSL